jgi:RNA polymerase sigma-70 factor (ECF subfamily)
LRACDTLVVTELSRLGRNVGDLGRLLDHLEEKGVALEILNLGIDTRTAAGRLIFVIIGTVAEMERQLLVERTQSGLAAGRARGRVGGRRRSFTTAQQPRGATALRPARDDDAADRRRGRQLTVHRLEVPQRGPSPTGQPMTECTVMSNSGCLAGLNRWRWVGCTRGVRPAKPWSGVGVPAGGPVTDRDFDAFVAPHAAVLMAIAARLVGVDDAADVVQEALLRSWRRWSTFDPAKGTLRAWLAAITVDRARRHRRGLPRANLRTTLTDLPDVPARDSDHAQRLVIEAVVRSLPRRQREVIVVFYLADMSVEQTARALGLRPGSVKAHLAAARARLKTALEDM